MNGVQEKQLRDKFKNNEITEVDCLLTSEFNNAIRDYAPIVNKWYNTCQTGEFMEMPEINKKYKHVPDIIYFIHKNFRSKFKNLWTYETDNDNCFCVKKVTASELEQLIEQYPLNDKTLMKLLGFRRVFKLLTSLNKPIIGHNLMQDLMIIINNFEAPLPRSYLQFKQLTNRLFPIIFDTKTIYYELRNQMDGKLFDNSSLSCLFNFFKNESGRHLVSNSPPIECNVDAKNYGNYHEAGWDSFCAGYLFIRLAYLNIAGSYPKSKKFVTNELISGLDAYKNRVNIIRGSSSHIVSVNVQFH